MPRPLDPKRNPEPARQPPAPPGVAPAHDSPANDAPLSLNRLRAAFAQMLGAEEQSPSHAHSSKEFHNPQSPAPGPLPPDPCEINPRSIVEAMLFVGRPDSQPFTARELAASMRGVSPAEIEAAVGELNRAYERDESPYEITGTASGYRLAIRDDYRRMRDKFHGRIREARLSPAALEVLSIVAYNQPVTAEAINELRAAPSGSALNWLVRRKLVEVVAEAEPATPPRYATTERFLRLFGLESVAALPRNEELEKI